MAAYSYKEYKDGSVEIIATDGVSIAFLQGDDADSLMTEINKVCLHNSEEVVSYILSQYDTDDTRAAIRQAAFDLLFLDINPTRANAALAATELADRLNVPVEYATSIVVEWLDAEEAVDDVILGRKGGGER